MKSKILQRKKLVGLFSLSFLPTQIFIGFLVGFFLSKLLAGKRTGERGLIKSIIISFNNWKIHLHHWFLSSILLFFSFLDFIYLSQFFLGFLLGSLVQGLGYSDWYRLVFKEIKYK